MKTLLTWCAVFVLLALSWSIYSSAGMHSALEVVKPLANQLNWVEGSAIAAGVILWIVLEMSND